VAHSSVRQYVDIGIPDWL